MSFLSEVLPLHLQSLVPSQWAIWRWFVLRGAGFPAILIDRLAQPLCAAAADKLILAEEALESCFKAAIHDCNSILDRFTAEGLHHDDEHFKTVLRAQRRLIDRKLPKPAGLPEGLAVILQAIQQALAERDRLLAQFEEDFLECIEKQADELQAIAANPRFQEAVLWQNRNAFETAVLPACRGLKESARNQRQRNREQLIARYAQRYCLKNDSIGFFGPVVWGRIEPDAPGFDMRPGVALIDRRRAYFEAWAIHRFAAGLSRIKGMDWWISPRFSPDVYLADGMLHRPGIPAAALSGFEQAVLGLCDGNNLPSEILRRVRAIPAFQATGEKELRDVLQAKAAEGVLVWRFLVPVEMDPEVNLRRQLSNIGDPELRAAAMSFMDQLEDARDAVGQAAGNPVELNNALRRVEFTFENTANTPGYRNQGATYGARAILYEDCRRDLALQFTPELLRPIAPAFSLLLRSLRWLMQATALEFYRLFHETYRELAARTPQREVRLLEWWLYTEPRLLNAPTIAEIETLFKQKWTEILPVEAGISTLQFDSGKLKDKVDRLFPEFGPGYHPVRYFCPDLMLAAKDAEAIRRGNVLYVLGEVHSAKNSLCQLALVQQHPALQELVAATQWDLAEACFKIVFPQDEMTAVRTSDAVLRPADFMVATTPDSIAPTGHESHLFSDLLLQACEGELYAVNSRDGRRFHILEAFSDLLFGFMINKASWIPPLPRVPRVLIDNLVIQRESWRFSRRDLGFALEKDESKRFLEARKWRKAHGIPRKTFVKCTAEFKPFYLDLESPVLVECFCRTIHHMNSTPEQAGELVLAEMLPGPEQLWLRDAAGNSYTSELRLAIVDLEARALSMPQKKAGEAAPAADQRR